MPAITATSGMPSPNRPILVTSCKGLTQCQLQRNTARDIHHQSEDRQSSRAYSLSVDTLVRRRVFCPFPARGFLKETEDSVLYCKSMLTSSNSAAASSVLQAI